MATLLLMPEVATGDGEATLSQWVVAVGTPFRAGDTIAVVETAKAAVDIPAEGDGVLISTLVEEGADVAVGVPVALLGAAGEQVADVGQALAELGVSDGVVATPPPVDDAPEPALARAGEGRAAVNGAALTDRIPNGTGPGPAPHRIFASPLARRLAREAELTLAELVGTGPGGRIVRRDVEGALDRRTRSGSPAPESPFAAAASPVAWSVPSSAGEAASWTDVPHSRLRRAIARRLTESVQTAPQFTVSGRARVDRLLVLRAEINAATDARVSVNDLVVKAVAVAHQRVPEMNVVWTEDAVRQFSSVDVAVAVATPTGLVTPVLRGVESLRVSQVASRSRELVERAREGRLQQAELEGGSTSVSNLGMFGTHAFTAIVNPPHASILAVGAASPEAVVTDGAVEVAQVLHLTASVDHRPVDGAVAAQWMRALVEAIEHPLALVV